MLSILIKKPEDGSFTNKIMIFFRVSRRNANERAIPSRVLSASSLNLLRGSVLVRFLDPLYFLPGIPRVLIYRRDFYPFDRIFCLPFFAVCFRLLLEVLVPKGKKSKWLEKCFFLKKGKKPQKSFFFSFLSLSLSFF